MIDVLLPAILLVSILTLAVAVRNLRSSRRSEALGEDRYELLRDQYDRLEFLREERQVLTEELERQSRERQQLAEFLSRTPAQLVEDLKKERGERLEAQERSEDLKRQRLGLEQELNQMWEQLERERQQHLESQQRAEQLEREQGERSGIQQELERLGQEHRRSIEALQREREERAAAQQRADQLEQERERLEGDLWSLRAKLDSPGREPTRDKIKKAETSHRWWRRPVLVLGLLLGVLVVWLTSLLVAVYLMSL